MTEISRATLLFSIQDYARFLLFNSVTENQIQSARSLLNKTNEELKMLYIPTSIENV